MTPADVMHAVLEDGRRLDAEESRMLFEAILGGAIGPDRIRELLKVLRDHLETADELVGAAQVLRAHALTVPGVPFNAVDTCGTGGDGAGTFNISTAAALVVAGAGVPVAKHGNRAMSGPGGSADVLELLGVRLELPPAKLPICLNELGIVYLHAPLHHPVLAKVAGIRKTLPFRTIFNLLGPLANPAGVTRQVIGVPKNELLDPMAEALSRLGAEHAWVVCGDNRFDELALSGVSRVASVRGNRIDRFELTPEGLGLNRTALEALKVSSVAESADRIRKILGGKAGPDRDVVCLNAAAALVVADAVPDMRKGLVRAAESIDQGSARGVLDRLCAFTTAASEAST